MVASAWKCMTTCVVAPLDLTRCGIRPLLLPLDGKRCDIRWGSRPNLHTSSFPQTTRTGMRSGHFVAKLTPDRFAASREHARAKVSPHQRAAERCTDLTARSTMPRQLSVEVQEVLPEVRPQLSYIKTLEPVEELCDCGRHGKTSYPLAEPCQECAHAAMDTSILYPSTEDHLYEQRNVDAICAPCEALRSQGNIVGTHACYEMLEYDAPKGSRLRRRAVAEKVMLEALQGWGTFTLRRYLDLGR